MIPILWLRTLRLIEIKYLDSRTYVFHPCSLDPALLDLKARAKPSFLNDRDPDGKGHSHLDLHYIEEKSEVWRRKDTIP